ncbi:salicylic acid-binding protein 2-like [Vigna radiata var. radiata]|uniref:Salicylic acid-binding protein 2-like n=1 Tax=Vigna radiata var. radiata TaxID=3916 RepID=A0A1S3VAS8_VIGRR|nr:salicylic acid-binding protein 2-like [Vigna radiata var. radiata]
MLKREKYHLVIFVIFLHFLFVCVNGKHFVLVHGAFHGAWCWYKVADQLKSEGENVTSLDMAACGVNTKQSEEVDSVSEYHKPLITFLASLPPQEKVILVGHSLGGLSVSLAMEKYPQKISVAVFITAAVVTHNLTFLAFLQEANRRLGNALLEQYFILDGNKAPILSSIGVEFFRSRLYQLSTTEDLTLAVSLVRPLPPFMSDVKLLEKQSAVSKKRNGRVSKVFIIAEKDNLIPKEFQRWIIQNTGPFADVKKIKNSDHMVMISKPKELALELLKIAYKF